jgi:hypothetical protein
MNQSIAVGPKIAIVTAVRMSLPIAMPVHPTISGAISFHQTIFFRVSRTITDHGMVTPPATATAFGFDNRSVNPFTIMEHTIRPMNDTTADNRKLIA